MGSNEEIIKKVLAEYELLRTKAENMRDKRVEEIYAACPRLKEIKAEINRAGFENLSNIMKNPQNSKAFNEAFEKKIKQLESEKEALLIKNNIQSDFEKPSYACSACCDTGYVGNEKCDCFKEKLVKAAYEKSNLGKMIKEHSFENFSLDYYSLRRKSTDEMSERENMSEILEECKTFCKNFDAEEKNLLFIGKPGLGKTFLSDCIANELLKQGKNVIYTRATSLFSAYEDYRFGRKSDGFDQNKFYNADLLIIDDLGTENITKSGVSFFFDLMNERLDRSKKIIINSNFTMSEISKTYSARITSRFYEHFRILHFTGEDIRIQKLKRS